MNPRSLVLAVIASILLFSSAQAADNVDAAETRRLHALFDPRWEMLMKTYPEGVTYNGDNRYGDRLNDASREAIAAEFAATRRAPADARTIRREGLSAKDQISLDIHIYRMNRAYPVSSHRCAQAG